MSDKSRRHIKLAAGAILAGAAIPIASAGAAWADDTSTPDETQRAGQLHREGLTGAEARAVVAAEKDGTAVEVSHDNTIVVNDNNADGTATASSGTTHDVAAAIGDGSTATDNTGDSKDRAFANGAGTSATITDASGSKATADGMSSFGAASDADIGGRSSTPITDSSATATNGGLAQVLNGLSSSATSVGHDHAIASGFGVAETIDSSSSHATERNAGSEANPGNFNAEVFDATKSDAHASGTNSVGIVSGTNTTPITGSAAVDNNGSTTTVTTSNTFEYNGAPIGSADVGTDAGALHVPLLP
jgi:hypothetical protein